jgi:hypothetical protein
MGINELNFPVICFSQNVIRMEKSSDSLTTCSKTALRNGYFENLLIIDSKGVALRITGAKKLHGVGLFSGYNLFLNQRIKVELVSNGEAVQISTPELKQKVLNSFRNRHGWSSRGDFESLRNSIVNASSITEIITMVGE